MAHYVDGFVIPLPKKPDPRLAKMMDPKEMPFDLKRMMYGGFKTIVEA